MTTTYRVERDGVVIAETTTDSYEGIAPFGEHLTRPAESSTDSPVHLYINDELVGIQRSHTAEADLAEQQANDADAAGHTAEAARLRAGAAVSRGHAAMARLEQETTS